MRVICINDDEQYSVERELPNVKKGNIYTVVDKIYEDYEEYDEYYFDAGYYYTFVETGDDASYHESAFIEINEDQKDEKEFERNYNNIQLTNNYKS